MYKVIKVFMISLLLVSITVISIIAFSIETSDYTLGGFNEITPYVDSNRYTHQKSDEQATSTQEINPEYIQILTDLGIVHIDPISLAFQFENSNGYIWSSTIDYQNEEFPNSVLYTMRSALNIESYNTDNVNYTVVRENMYTPGTTIDLEYIENGFNANIIFGISKIEIELIVLFEEDSIKVSIPSESIIEGDKYKLKGIKVYRDFGAVKNDDVPGYVFIPDGIGALIDYKNDTLGLPNYSKAIYGNALGYNTNEDLSEFDLNGANIYVPVFGFVHGVNQQSVFANIESGGEYGNLNVYYPSKNRGYTTVFSDFKYRSTYNQPVDQIGNVITLLQKHRNDFDINIAYHFLNGEQANYVGMAVKYREYLLAGDVEFQENNANTDIPLHLSFIGSERRPTLLFTKKVQLTTLEDIIRISDELKEYLTINLVVSIDGFTKDGSTWSGPLYKDIDKSFGNEEQLKALQDKVAELYLITNHVMANSTNGGYNSFSDLAKKINDQIYTYENRTSSMYLLEHDKVFEKATNSINELDDYDFDGFAFKYMGSILYDDFRNNSYIVDQIILTEEFLEELDKDIALYNANSYMFPYIDSYFDFPLYSSQFITFDDTVPFLSIALSDIVNLYSPYANFFPQNRDDLLRMIDFHVYPSFILTDKSSKELQDTNLEAIYSSKYDSLEPAVYQYYEFLNDALRETKDATIVDRDVLDEGVIKVTYSNGVYIVINYTDISQVYYDDTILPKSYLVGDES